MTIIGSIAGIMAGIYWNFVVVSKVSYRLFKTVKGLRYTALAYAIATVFFFLLSLFGIKNAVVESACGFLLWFVKWLFSYS